jgi:lycopene cyclase domain-containing protein
MTYTAFSLAAVLTVLAADRWLLRTRLTSTAAWWLAYAIILVFQLITNGWLTGRGIVTYSDDAIIGSGGAALLGDGRLVYAPIEDVGFGFALVLCTCAVWVRSRPEEPGT